MRGRPRSRLRRLMLLVPGCVAPTVPRVVLQRILSSEIAQSFLVGSEHRSVAEARAVHPQASEIARKHSVTIGPLHALDRAPGGMRNGESRRPFGVEV